MNWYEDLFYAKTEPFPNFPDLHVHHGYEQNRESSKRAPTEGWESSNGREGEPQQKGELQRKGEGEGRESSNGRESSTRREEGREGELQRKGALTPNLPPIRFLTAYQSLKSQMLSSLKKSMSVSNSTLIIATGHSLGAAIATIAVMDLKLNEFPNFRYALYTQGSPRVGDRAFSEKFGSGIFFFRLSTFIPFCIRRLIKFKFFIVIDGSFREVHMNDLVVHVPLEKMGFQHVPFEIFFSENFGSYSFCNSTLSGEDPKCSDSLTLPLSITDHVNYFGIPVGDFCDCGLGQCPDNPKCQKCREYTDCSACAAAPWYFFSSFFGSWVNFLFLFSSIFLAQISNFFKVRVVHEFEQVRPNRSFRR
jgi:hypothetical protein